MNKLLFFDIDGTLVDFDGKMPESTVEALKLAQSNGHKIFLCTGRSYNQIYQYLLDFGFDGIVAAAGGYVEYQGEVIYHRTFGRDILESLMQVVAGTPTAILLQNKEKSITSKHWGEAFERAFESHLGKQELKDNTTFSKLVIDDDIATYADRYQDAESCIYCESNFTNQEMEKILPKELKVTASSFKEPEPYSGEITLKDVNKAVGMAKIMEALGLKREDTIGFGDGANDLDMLHFAGTGVAMGNSQECALNAADIITDDIKEDGLYRAMKRLRLI